MTLRTSLIALAAVPVLAVPALVLPTTAVAAPVVGLEGAQEVPGPGDSDASGAAKLSLKPNKGTVCFDLSWADVDGTVVAAHIHQAPSGVVGPVVVGLFSGSFESTDAVGACIPDVDKALVQSIKKHPEAYYVNVHSSVYPAGAIRGQLG